MSFAEIQNEISLEYDSIRESVIKKMGHEESRIRRHLLKNHKKESIEPIIFKPFSLKSKHGNTYKFFYYSFGYSHYKRNGLLGILVCHYLKNDGIWVTFRPKDNEGDINQIFFAPHFFQRYRERYLKDPKVDIMDVIGHYLINNKTSVTEDYSAPEHPQCILSVVKNGVLLGERIEETTLLYKTFLTFDMLKDSQIEEIIPMQQARNSDWWD